MSQSVGKPGELSHLFSSQISRSGKVDKWNTMFGQGCIFTTESDLQEIFVEFMLQEKKTSRLKSKLENNKI